MSSCKRQKYYPRSRSASNLDAAIPMRSADTELQDTLELRGKVLEMAAPKPDLDAKGKKHDFEAVLKGKSPAPKLEKSADMMIHSNTI